MPRRFLNKLRALFRRGSIEREMQNEMEAHLERAVERLVARGISEEEARRTALREFGNVPSLQEEGRDARGVLWFESLLADLRFAFRSFRRTPLVTATVVLLLAVGIGVNIALFAFIYSALTQPPAGVPKDDLLVQIDPTSIDARDGRTSRYRSMSYLELKEYESRKEIFSAVAGFREGFSFPDIDPGGGRPPQRVALQYVSSNYFSVLGVPLTLGTGFTVGEIAETGTPSPHVVLSHGAWDQIFGSDPGVIGQTVRIGGAPVTVVGVTPPRFAGVANSSFSDILWLPLSARPLLGDGSPAALASYDSLGLTAVARLQHGISRSEATAHARLVAQRAGEASTQAGIPEFSVDVGRLVSGVRIDPAFGLTFVIPVLILVAMCTNVASLLAAAALARQREIAVRLAIGASRQRVIRQLLTESAVRAVLGGAVGALIVVLLFGWWVNQVSGMVISFDWVSVLYTLAISIGVGLLFGLLPALHASAIGVADALKASAASIASSSTRLSRSFAATQIALTQPLLAFLFTSAIFHGSLWLTIRTSEVDERIAVVSLAPSSLIPPRERDAAESFMQLAEDRVSELAGVTSVTRRLRGGPSHFPIREMNGDNGLPAGPTWQAITNYAGPNYFEVMNFPVVLGRGFLPEDRHPDLRPTPVVMERTVARELFGDRNPLNARLYLGPTAGFKEGREVVVVGIVDEGEAAHEMGRERQDVRGLNIFLPTFVSPVGPVWTNQLYIRTAGPVDALLPSIQKTIREEIPELIIDRAVSLSSIRNEERTTLRITSLLLVVVASLAILLSAVGLYGVISTSVARRVREVGIRMALGATEAGVTKMFVREGVRLSLFGLLLGLPVGLIVLRILSPEIDFLVPRMIVASGAITAAIALCTALLASWLPARRAAAVDPMTVLRAE